MLISLGCRSYCFTALLRHLAKLGDDTRVHVSIVQGSDRRTYEVRVGDLRRVDLLGHGGGLLGHTPVELRRQVDGDAHRLRAQCGLLPGRGRVRLDSPVCSSPPSFPPLLAIGGHRPASDRADRLSSSLASASNSVARAVTGSANDWL